MQQHMVNQQQGSSGGAGGREPAVGRFLLPVAECSFTLESVLEVCCSSLAVSGDISLVFDDLSFKCATISSGLAKGSVACTL